MQIENNSDTIVTSAIAIAVTTELATRVFEKLAGGIISNEINGVALNRQAVSSLVSARLSQEILAKAEVVK